MKPHQVRAMVNELRDTAVIYSDTHQLRERIAHVVHKYLAEPQADLDMLGMLFEENQRLLCEVSQLTKREWVGLTDEDINFYWAAAMDRESERHFPTCHHAFAYFLENRLKDENNG